ncbi:MULTISPECIES: response regulator transcription factor [Micromonospora]|uniref:DNA-binding response regulator, OmpR family, contains REC and winged-helix (WHTH) domain n=1 Tax=Micromonospora tulbaghiae TaxID=479978 RepID=A0AAW4JPA0_9ACTN|nr:MULTISPECIES: response regulator transcription factor [Micromonospora]KAB1903880.1 response regulator transcription factor [Micromonospora sp. AMSO1212t]MBO4143703.1 response regulator transcription factor [Micromonospora tulbaghiae]MCO1618004.1 response regulator transcription factor [Micromonospora sp. CPM1]MDX5461105.1 response regulator transcription factor [Micromonospora tulbaghiae]SCF17210.1 DNA-binding response regulator, OmpR family, contains REC and winged-helix (wHTH) domain [Mic
MTAVLVIEDDDRIRLALQLALEEEGYEAYGAPTAEDGLRRQREKPADYVLVDLMLPGMNGFDCIRQLRRDDDVPVVVISARDDTHDIVAALEAGADDYVVKPVAIKELSARLRALRRRVRTVSGPVPAQFFGDLEISAEAGEVRRSGQPVPVTRTEFRLLCELAEHAGRVLSRQQLLSRVWGYETGDERLVDVHVGRLRQKIEPDPANPRHLVTLRGLGYKLQR